jgi:hypothetical protein
MPELIRNPELESNNPRNVSALHSLSLNGSGVIYIGEYRCECGVEMAHCDDERPKRVYRCFDCL